MGLEQSVNNRVVRSALPPLPVTEALPQLRQA